MVRSPGTLNLAGAPRDLTDLYQPFTTFTQRQLEHTVALYYKYAECDSKCLIYQSVTRLIRLFLKCTGCSVTLQ